jgi:hypothetical protein
MDSVFMPYTVQLSSHVSLNFERGAADVYTTRPESQNNHHRQLDIPFYSSTKTDIDSGTNRKRIGNEEI